MSNNKEIIDQLQTAIESTMNAQRIEPFVMKFNQCGAEERMVRCIAFHDTWRGWSRHGILPQDVESSIGYFPRT